MIFSYSGDMRFYIKGTQFPVLGQASTNAGLGFLAPSTSPFTISIDYSDGAGYTTYASAIVGGFQRVQLFDYNGTNVNPTVGAYAGKTFTSVNDRLIRVKCSNWSLITQFAYNNIPFSKQQVFGPPYNLMTALTTISSNFSLTQATYGFVTELSSGLFNLKNLTSFGISLGIFDPSSRYYGMIQNDFLNKNLNILGFDAYGFPGKTFAQTNISAITGTSLPNLTQLSIGGNGIYYFDDNSGDGPFPIQWTTLSGLIRFNIDGARWTKIPDRVNQLSPTLQFLTMSGTSTITDWPADMSNLVNLAGLTYNAANNFTNSVPSYIAALTKLKNVTFNNIALSTRPAGFINTLIDNWYSIIVANAPMTGANSLPFRGMAMNFSSTSGQVPTGTYQAPSGFVLGSSNGTPANAQEKVYVMQVQYGHTWTIPS